MQGRPENEARQTVPQHGQPRPLSDALESLGVDDRSWYILDRRLGPGNSATLAAVAADVGLTRERVRQVQKQTTEKIYGSIGRLAPLLKVYENGLGSNWFTPAARSKGASLIEDVGNITERQQWGDEDPQTIRRLVVALRAVVDEYPELELGRFLPTLTYACCVVDPPVKAHETVLRNLRRWEQEAKDKRRNWRYDELAEVVLRRAAQPLHWAELADEAESLGRRKNFSRTSFFNAVQANDRKFARVDSGTYGLTEWGLSDVANYTDIVAELLNERGLALSEGVIYHEVRAQRSVEHGSLVMLLDLNVRFYKSIEQTYGLRSWLPERHRQNLRTPRWLVEDPESFERVTRAEQRGYQVAEIVERDRLRYPSPSLGRRTAGEV